MVHLLVLGLLALLFDCFIRCVGTRDFLLLHRFSRGRDCQSIVSTITINDFSIVFASDCLALSFSPFEVEASGGSTKTAARTSREPTTAGKAESG